MNVHTTKHTAALSQYRLLILILLLLMLLLSVSIELAFSRVTPCSPGLQKKIFVIIEADFYTASKHRREFKALEPTRENHPLDLILS